MCENCGCAVTPGNVRILDLEKPHSHTHEHPHEHPHHHEHHNNHRHKNGGSHTHTLEIHEAILSKNDRLAERNRGFFMAKNLVVLNVLSSPGSGKTALLERTLTELGSRLSTAVIVGDLETDNDAQRLRKSGAQVVQIVTENVCHLEAEMVANAAKKLDLDEVEVLAIENVGNLVCPAAYDLGETRRVALLSTTEGEDKPLKYPTLFKSVDVVLVNKIDIAEVVGFDRDLALENIRRVAPQAQILEVSARTGEGIDAWYRYVETLVSQRRELAVL
ncbi:MAG: hydrogenase nickel incorporation protein HypB [Cyanobacteria bacterium SBC]|nr:hydrogenase nickel incorporation protein HypB [Cyanobacteria bacterium SBC]